MGKILVLLFFLCLCTNQCWADFEEEHEVTFSDGKTELRLVYERKPRKNKAYHYWVPVKQRRGRQRSGRGFRIPLKSLPKLMAALDRCVKGGVGTESVGRLRISHEPGQKGKFRVAYGKGPYVLLDTHQVREMGRFWRRKKLNLKLLTEERHTLVLFKGRMALRASFLQTQKQRLLGCAVGPGPDPTKKRWQPPEFGVRNEEIPKFLKWLRRRAKRPSFTDTFKTGAYLLALGKSNTYVMVQTTEKGRFKMPLTKQELSRLLTFFDGRD